MSALSNTSSCTHTHTNTQCGIQNIIMYTCTYVVPCILGICHSDRGAIIAMCRQNVLGSLFHVSVLFTLRISARI